MNTRRMLVPPPETILDEAGARSAPVRTGVYAAWIVDQQSLTQCGVAGPEPRAVYIGKASGRGGLRSRLLRHARLPFWSLLDLLASRGTILPGWWHYAFKNQPHRRVLKVPPLAKLAEDAALAWQHEHLRWGWMALDLPRPLETALITEHQPLLNLQGRGFLRLGPPQLRLIGEFEQARSAWLFSAAWIALLTYAGDEWNTWISRGIGLEVDDEGWPMPLGHGGRRVKLKLPKEPGAQRIVRKVHDVEFNAFDDEAFAWWSAYAGLAFRPQTQSVDQALRHAFRCEVDALDMPHTLPAPERLVDLLKLIKLLPGVAH